MRINKKRLNKIIDIVLNFFIILFIIILFFSLYMGFQIRILKNDYANFFGYSLFETQTGSMKDTINPGDWIVVKLTKDVKIGDIVTYKLGPDFITHRIVESYKGTYITKGDNNKAKDEPIDESQIIGKVDKVLNNFGIIRKTIFNKRIIFLLIIVLFIFNIFMKDDKDNAKYEAKIKLFIRRSIAKLKKSFNIKDDNPIVNEKKNAIEKEIALNVSNKDEASKENNKKIVEEIIKQEKKAPKKVEKDLDSTCDLSKTSMFRIISIDNNNLLNKEYKGRTKEDNDGHEELSSIIQADTSDINSNGDIKDKNNVLKLSKEKDEKKNYIGKEVTAKRTNVGGNYINFNELEESVSKQTEKFMDAIDVTKAKNPIDKILQIKELELYEILDILNLDNYEYVKKSSLKDDFIEEYIKVYYINQETDIKKIHSHFAKFSKILNTKYIRNDVTLRVIKILANEMEVIAKIEDSRHLNSTKNRIYDRVLGKYFEWSNDYIEFISNSIMNIQDKVVDKIETNLKKIETDVFEMKKKKLSFKDRTYYIYLNHNIKFSKVYSDYIVDKTYNEGLIAEDKIALLLSLLSINLAEDLLSFKNNNYVLELPSSLYDKEKKIDSLFKMIDNEYARNHCYLLVDSEDLVLYKKEIQSLRKKGYNFITTINSEMDEIQNNLEQFYLVDTCILDSSNPFNKKVIKMLPKEIRIKTVFENVLKFMEK